jgi:hypothetical protein
MMSAQRARRELLDEDEVAALLRISVRSLQRRRVDGLPPRFVKLGARVLYDLDDINAWVDASLRSPTSEVQP